MHHDLSALEYMLTSSYSLQDLGAASFDYGDSMIALASAELNRPLSVHLTVLGELQQKMKDLHETQVSRMQFLAPSNETIF